MQTLIFVDHRLRCSTFSIDEICTWARSPPTARAVERPVYLGAIWRQTLEGFAYVLFRFFVVQGRLRTSQKSTRNRRPSGHEQHQACGGEQGEGVREKTKKYGVLCC